MPEEYVRTGRSKKSPSSAKSRISGSRRRISGPVSPSSAAFMRAFSRPVNSGWKPIPSSRIEATTPCRSTEPEVGCVVPATIFRSVDLPAPFSPIRPSARPRASSKDTSVSAWNPRCRGAAGRAPAGGPTACRRAGRSSRPFRLERRSRSSRLPIADCRLPIGPNARLDHRSSIDDHQFLTPRARTRSGGRGNPRGPPRRRTSSGAAAPSRRRPGPPRRSASSGRRRSGCS